jgi:hypothetical protein
VGNRGSGRSLQKWTFLRNSIPALIVALVLASSFALSAGAKQTGNHDQGSQCGYGYGDSDNDELDNHRDSAVQANANKLGHDNDKCEDEIGPADDGGNGERDNDNDRGGGR